jgi:hypothetical protein
LFQRFELKKSVIQGHEESFFVHLCYWISSTSQELGMGGTRFFAKTCTPKKYLNLKLFKNIRGVMAKTSKCMLASANNAHQQV